MLDALTLSLLLVIILAVLFDYINGFHDSANAIATSVATRALRPRTAVLMAAAMNFAGAFAGTAVAKTIGAGLVDVETTTEAVVIAALIGAIVWNLFTWWYGIPSSSSHALIGGLLGATIVAAGVSALKMDGIITKVIIPMFSSPLIGFLLGLLFMVLLARLFFRARRRPASRIFRKAQVFSAGFMAFAHGSNDAQKTMGIIAVLLYSAGHIDHFYVPVWVIISAYSAISLGTLAGGWKVIRTMGVKLTDLKPVGGFCAETAGATMLIGTALGGIPVSTTHTIAGAIMGVGSTRRLSAVRWGIAGKIVWAWVFTIPSSAVVASLFYLLLGRFDH